MNTEIKYSKTDVLFYKIAFYLFPKILNFEWAKKLLNYSRGTHEEHLYREAFVLTISKTIFNFVISIILSIFLTYLIGFSVETIILCISMIIPLSIYPFAKIKREYKKNESDLDIGLENLVNELAILLSSGMSLESSMSLNRKDRNSYYVMEKFFKHLEESEKKGLGINLGILSFSKIYRNKHLNKLNIIIAQSKKKGTGKQVEALIHLGTEILNERRSNIKKKAETISTKMLMPLMVSMVGIIAMIMVPIFMQF